MLELSGFNTKTINTWLNRHINSNFLKIDNDFILPNTPFSVIVPQNLYQMYIKPLYVNNEEKGGLLLCSISNTGKKNEVIVEKVVEIKNVFVPTKEFPNRSKANTYLRCIKEYTAALEENFSHENPEKILFPIHFHTHPTIDEKAELEYYNTYTHLNTSPQDQVAATNRYLKFKNIKFRYLSAIITGHKNIHNILIYAPGVTPLDFVNVKTDRITNSFKKGGENLSELADSQTGKDALKTFAELGGALFNLYFHKRIDYMSHLFGDSEYFTTLNEKEPTIIQIPQIDKDGKIIPSPKKPVSIKFVNNRPS
ncbi:MAG: hypothetical protein WAQ28_09985 [Bacteroidia bacterium]|jgi:hypothetical protein